MSAEDSGRYSHTHFQSVRSFLCRSGLACFSFRAFSQRGFARKFYAAFVINANALNPDDVADLGDVFGPFHTKISQLGNVRLPVSDRENLPKRAEFLR